MTRELNPAAILDRDMVCSISTTSDAAYYIGAASQKSRPDYYGAGSDESGVWLAPDREFGIEDGLPVDADLFRSLHSGLGADGADLSASTRDPLTTRVGAYDLTYSPPKSVSILWAAGTSLQRMEILRAQERAVRESLAVIDRCASYSRRGSGGIRLERVALRGALFHHCDARPVERSDGTIQADPQLHTHAVLLNIAKRADGTWGALDGRHLYRWKMAAGAVYRCRLAAELRQCGFRIEASAGTSFFEVAGVPRTLIDEFSGRRSQIVAEVGRLGTTTGQASAVAASITRSSRRSKQGDLSQTDRDDQWTRRLETLGHSPGNIYQNCRFPERSLLKSTHASQDNPHATTKEIISSLTEHEAVVSLESIYRTAAASLLTKESSARVADMVDHVIADPEILMMTPDRLQQPRYSTAEMVKIESEIVTISRRLTAAPSRVEVHLAAEPSFISSSLTVEQREAVSQMIEGGRVVVLEGKAGAGKSTALRSVVEKYRQQGARVIGSATAWRIANQLGRDCGIESKATDAWLRDQSFLEPSTVLIVDEAGQLSSRQMHRILVEADRKGSKIILCGDRRQLQAIGAGSGLRIVAEIAPVAQLDVIQRQRSLWLRQAVEDLSSGKVERALKAFVSNQSLHFENSAADSVRRIADRWIELTFSDDGETGSVLLMAKTNAEADRVNIAVRSRLRELQHLTGTGITIAAARPRGRIADIEIAAGERIRFLRRIPALGVVNGTSARVINADVDKSGQAVFKIQIGEAFVSCAARDLCDRQGRVPIAYDYATSIYSSQGATVDYGLVVGSSSFTRNDAYVSISRARIRSEIFLSRNTVDAAIRAETPPADRHGLKIRDEHRVVSTAAAWSREHSKVTTIDNGLMVRGDGAKPGIRLGRHLEPELI